MGCTGLICITISVSDSIANNNGLMNEKIENKVGFIIIWNFSAFQVHSSFGPAWITGQWWRRNGLLEATIDLWCFGEGTQCSQYHIQWYHNKTQKRNTPKQIFITEMSVKLPIDLWCFGD
ncbi:hypothetical protein V8G54_032900 [Vigna mungo]|uniref:Uncharacterized protein n=1 Tax=Vigna mungo TaxID=3915 RepID=A0AAQ3MMC4_VIGMU